MSKHAHITNRDQKNPGRTNSLVLAIGRDKSPFVRPRKGPRHQKKRAK
jgi:hypothetical protein